MENVKKISIVAMSKKTKIRTVTYMDRIAFVVLNSVFAYKNLAKDDSYAL